MKRTKKVFRDDGGLSPAFCERLRHQIDIYHAVGHGLSIAHLYGAYEDAEYVYSVQELCTGMQIAAACLQRREMCMSPCLHCVQPLRKLPIRCDRVLLPKVMGDDLVLASGGELWQHIGDHYSEAYAAKIMRDVLRTIAQVCGACRITSHAAIA